jgi:hypothetical protein
MSTWMIFLTGGRSGEIHGDRMIVAETKQEHISF